MCGGCYLFACVEKNKLPFTNAIKNTLYVTTKIMLVISKIVALREEELI
jgi:hypothetical protein